MDENDPRTIVYLVLKYLGLDDAQKALDCDRTVCQDLILGWTACSNEMETWQKFLKYMRS